jgi:hypothetical protein
MVGEYDRGGFSLMAASKLKEQRQGKRPYNKIHSSKGHFLLLLFLIKPHLSHFPQPPNMNPSMDSLID